MLYLNQPKQNVKAYFSTDRGAPTLTNSNLGLIFQACLVEGFGDKEGAGWRTVLADAQENKYIFAPKRSSRNDENFFLQMEIRNGAAHCQCRVDMDATPDSGQKRLELSTPYKYGKNLYGADAWFLVASGRSVVFFTRTWPHGLTKERTGNFFAFGESTRSHRGEVAVFMAHSGGGYDDGAVASPFLYEPNWPDPGSRGTCAQGYLPSVRPNAAQRIYFTSLFRYQFATESNPRFGDTSERYLSPMLFDLGGDVFAVPGVFTHSKDGDNMTIFRIDEERFVLAHALAWAGNNHAMSRLAVACDKWSL